MNVRSPKSPIASASDVDTLAYQAGFGNEFESEAVPGSLPLGQNSPQRPPFDLCSELISGATFVAPRAQNRRSYVFRLRPSTVYGEFKEIDAKTFRSPPFSQPPAPNAYRWKPLPLPQGPMDFVDSMFTICGNGSPDTQAGMAVHVYGATRSMENRVFANSDGEMLILPEIGRLRLFTEFGLLHVKPGEIALIPRGIKFRVELRDAAARGFVCENFGASFRLPELGVIGSFGLANSVDFLAPVAAYEERETPTEFVQKYFGRLWATELRFSPLDVVAWRGNLTPCKYDLYKFVAYGSLTVDHADPSINTVLTSPGDPAMGANVDFTAVTPRWQVENSFPRAGFHRNCACEFSTILTGGNGVLETGQCHINNSWVPHGPEPAMLDLGRKKTLKPEWQDAALFILLESRYPLQVSDAALNAPERLSELSKRFADYDRRRDTLGSRSD